MGGVVEEGVPRRLRGVEPGAERGVGEPGVRVLESLRGVLGGTNGLGRVGEQRGLPLQLGGARGHTVGGTPGLRQLALQGGPFAVKGVAQGGTGGGPDRGLLLDLGPPLALLLGLAQLLGDGMQPGRVPACLLVEPPQLRDLVGELTGRRVPRLGGGSGQCFPYDAQAPLGLGALVLGALVGGEGLFLRRTVDVSGGFACGGGVFGGSTDGAGCVVGEMGGEFGGDAVESLFLEVEPVGAGRQCMFGAGEHSLLGVLGVTGELVPLPGRPEAPLGGLALHAELFGPGGGFLRRLDPRLKSRAGRVPLGEPGLGLLPYVLVGALLPVQLGALHAEFGEALLGAAGRLESAQFLGGPAGGGNQPSRTGAREGVRQQVPRA